MTDKIKTNKKKAITMLVALLIVGLFIANDLFYIGGNINFYNKWSECNKKPLRAFGSGFMNATVPYYAESPEISLLRGHPNYFCSPREAQLHGYSSSPEGFDFPDLSDKEASDVMLKYYVK